MHFKTLTQLRQALLAREISSVELTELFLTRIAEHEQLNAYTSVAGEDALATAREADRALNAGNGALLTGLPIAHKDIFCTAQLPTTCGSRMLDGYVSPFEATVVQRLREAGALVLGKTNMDEFAMGSSSETSWYGPVLNPWDPTRVPGGSSGGSAAAVAAGLAAAATGTDTGGSIRQPAALCGITGLKPTYGRVSRYGMVAFASSLDQAGPMTRSVADAALMLQAMAGFDPRDSTCLDEPVPDYLAALEGSVQGLRIGLPREYFDSQLDAAIGQTLRLALGELEAAGAQLVEIDLPSSRHAIPTYYVLAPAEASANLERFDGVRFGYRAQDPADLDDLYCRTRGEGFGREVKRRIMVGTFVLSAGYYDAYYRQAQRARRLIRDEFLAAFERVDLIAAPSSPDVAFAIGERSDDPLAMYHSDLYTIPVNLAGLPALSVPAGFVRNLPVGLQLIGRHLDEGTLLRVGHTFQQRTDWHLQTPPEMPR